jgi:small subunit ribosomal protein S6
MRHYEIIVILDAGLEDEAARGIVDRATQVLTDHGATVGKLDHWGKRRFAYEVHHRNEGYYVLIDTVAEPDAVAQVNRMLGLADDVIRHKVVRLPDKAVALAQAKSADGAAGAEANENGAD